MAIRLARNEIHHRARLEVSIGDLPAVEAGSHELGQVFLNLLVNAAQAIPEGHADENVIAVEAGRAPDGGASFLSETAASGSPPNVLERIFEPFFTTKALGVGTGLGLAIAHRIVSDAGGRIDVETQLGRGTAFRVTLPGEGIRPAVTAGAAPTEPEREGGERRVLVVDDDALVARAVARSLGKADVVTTAASAAEALAHIEGGERFDAVLCDLMMPQMTGMELHARVAERDPELARRMVFVTGGAFTDAAARFVADATNAVVEKPFEAARLREAVERASAGVAAPARALPPTLEPRDEVARGEPPRRCRRRRREPPRREEPREVRRGSRVPPPVLVEALDELEPERLARLGTARARREPRRVARRERPHPLPAAPRRGVERVAVRLAPGARRKVRAPPPPRPAARRRRRGARAAGAARGRARRPSRRADRRPPARRASAARAGASRGASRAPRRARDRAACGGARRRPRARAPPRRGGRCQSPAPPRGRKDMRAPSACAPGHFAGRSASSIRTRPRSRPSGSSVSFSASTSMPGRKSRPSATSATSAGRSARVRSRRMRREAELAGAR